MNDVPSATSYAGSGTATMIGVLTFNEWIALAGLLTAIATFLVNAWYKRKHFKLAERALEQGNGDSNAG